MTIKTASGIKRFQEERGYGACFNQLFEVVKTRDSCSPELATEPSASKEKNNQMTENEGIVDEHKNSCEVIYEMFHILNCGYEIK